MKRVAIFFLVLFFVAYVAILGSVCMAANIPKAVFPEISFSFGGIKQGQPLIHTFSEVNQGQAPLKIERVRPG